MIRSRLSLAFAVIPWLVLLLNELDIVCVG
jgi:hypothetical protein